jgi:hypothetical protein
VLSGCAGESENAENNATSDLQSCSGKCDSTDPANAFRPLVGLTLVDGEPTGADTTDAGSSDAGSTDTGMADAGLDDGGNADTGMADAGNADAGWNDAGSSDAGLNDTGTSEPVTESFHLVAAVSEDHLDDIADDHVVSAKVWTTLGDATSHAPLLADLNSSATQSEFSSQAIDAADLGDWDTLTVELSGSIGDESFEQIFEFSAGETEASEVIVDPYAEARDVDLATIELAADLDAPDYPYPSTDAPFGLSGTEFWQKWPGGHSPTYSYGEGTNAGQKCMSAAAIRFEAIMADPPASLIELEETSNWSGRFFNWNDDFSHPDANDSPNGAVLWAWRTHLIKWISQTGDDGRCYLPTRGLVERAAASCLQKAEQNDGEIKDCQAY